MFTSDDVAQDLLAGCLQSFDLAPRIVNIVSMDGNVN